MRLLFAGRRAGAGQSCSQRSMLVLPSGERAAIRAIGCLGRLELLLCPQVGRDQGPVSLVGKLICPRTCWDAPSWKPLGSLAVARTFLSLPIPVARWTWRQKHPWGICGSDCT